MEILLIACMLAYAAGAQSEQSKLGVSPAQRAILKEQTRHEKAVRKIADKHGVKPPAGKAGVSPWKEAPHIEGESAPSTFLSGYREARPSRPPLGHRAGARAGTAVTWAHDAGRDAWRTYRERRRKAGHDDPGPVLIPLPPTVPPLVPPIPEKAPSAGKADDTVKTAKATADPAPKATPGSEAKPEPAAAPKTESTEPWSLIPAEKPAAAEPTEPAPPTDTPAATPGGVGRMAAEVTYESVMDESDELTVMCEDDALVYDRIKDRAEREIGRGDTLVAQLEAAGFGSKVISWVVRCREIYGVIRSEVDDLKANTVAQGEAVVKAKALLEAGQGVYADIAKDMESVAAREAYISDAVDAEDTSAHTETYETKAA
jgi:hypothetical protein